MMREHHDTISKEYSEHAEYYDRRWQRYNEQTLHQTLAAITLTETEKPPRLLDVACGTGLLLSRIHAQHEGIHLHGCDITRSMLSRARQRTEGYAKLKLAPAEQLPFDKDYFDCVVCSSAAQYFADPAHVFREMHRVLKPSGELVLTTWSADKLLPRIHYKLLQRYGNGIRTVKTSKDYARLLSANGFQIQSQKIFNVGIQWGLTTFKATKLANRL